MRQNLITLSTVAILAVTASAQCFEPNFGIPAPHNGGASGIGDDVLFNLQPMNFAFPMGGIAASYTHAHIQSNGVIFLTNGTNSGATTTGYSTVPATQLANLRGAAGSAPRIAPMWRDLNLLAANGGGVFFNNTVPGKFVVTYSNAVQYGTTSPVFTVQAQLFATGEVHFFYDGLVESSLAMISGLSEGNAVTPVPEVDFTAVAGNSSSIKLIYEQFGNDEIDTQNKFLHFAPNVFGGYDELAADCGAFNRNYGKGCYDISDSFYEYFSQASTAAVALTAHSLVLQPTGSQYLASWGGGTYVAPTVAAVDVFAVPMDDGEAMITPSVAFPSPTGPQATIRLHSNGIVSWGATQQTFPGTNSWTPTPDAFLNAVNAGIYAGWHDWNEAEAGSGRIKREEMVVGSDTVLFLTWDNVENYSVPVCVNPGTMQIQMNLTTGVVTVVWQFIDANSTSVFGSGHLVGYSPAGPSVDPSSSHLALALPLVTSSDNVPALELRASPEPVSTTTAGTVVTYTTDNIPEFLASSGVYVGLNILSVGPVPLGLDLVGLGAPGCKAYVSTLDLTQSMIGATSTQSVTFTIPAAVPPGFEIYSQSAALITPFSLPNGQNAAGLLTSNGVRQRIDMF